jgi:hypothetical protein
MAYVTTNTSLPLSLDVQISVSKMATLGRLDLSTMCIVGEDLGMLQNANRVRFYLDISSVGDDFGTTSDVYKAAQFFFSQSPRANQLAIGEAFLTAQPAYILAATLTAAQITTLKTITTGSMVLAIGGVAHNITALNFSAVTTLASIATLIQSNFTANSIPATCTVKTLPGGVQKLIIAPTVTTATVAYPAAHVSGAFCGTALNMTAAAGGTLLQAYTPTDIASELDNIQNAANSAGQFIYGWTFVSTLRDVDIQMTAAAWALTQTAACMPLVSSDPNAYDPSYTTDLASQLKLTLNRRCDYIFTSNLDYYPDVSILAYMLSVNYLLQDSTTTAKFKQLPGMNPEPLAVSQWLVLKSKGYNAYTQTGTNALVYREGTSGDESTPWFMDTLINMDNFVQDLSVNVYNVFLRNRKVPYTTKGQMMLVDACNDTGRQYVYNGTFADRQVTDTSAKSGVKIVPAVVTVPTPINLVSVSVRASRVGPPIQMTVQEASAIHSVAIAVELVS